MSDGLKFGRQAQYGKSMTLDELEDFVRTARVLEVDGRAKVRARVNFGAGIREVSVTSGELVEPHRATT